MDKKFEVNQKNIKGGCQSYTKAAHQDSKSDLPLTSKTITIFTFKTKLFRKYKSILLDLLKVIKVRQFVRYDPRAFAKSLL